MTESDDTGAALPRPIQLVDGRRLVIREARPGDEAALGRLYESLSPADRHRRFFSAFRPSREVLEHWVRASRRGDCRILAVLDGERIVADAGFYRLPGSPHEAELDITVTSEMRGGFGTCMLDTLIEAAAERGVDNLHAEILLDNDPMLALIESRGGVRMEPSDPGVIQLTIGTRTPRPVWSDDVAGPRVLVEQAAGDWPGAASARSYGMQVAVCPGPGHDGGRRCPALTSEGCPLAAEADVIVFGLPLDDPGSIALLESHPDLHPQALLCVEPPRATDDIPVDLRDSVLVLDHRDPEVASKLLERLGDDTSLPRRGDRPQPATR